MSEKLMDDKCCGTFRKCEFSDGVEKWIVQTDHAHAEGDTITIERRDGTVVEAVLGSPLEVTKGTKPVSNCFMVSTNLRANRPSLIAMESATPMLQ